MKVENIRGNFRRNAEFTVWFTLEGVSFPVEIHGVDDLRLNFGDCQLLRVTGDATGAELFVSAPVWATYWREEVRALCL